MRDPGKRQRVVNGQWKINKQWICPSAHPESASTVSGDLDMSEKSRPRSAVRRNAATSLGAP